MRNAEARVTTTRNYPGWYEIYSAAMLENRQRETRSQIERAYRAIQDRVSELRTYPAQYEREAADLSHALNYLEILRQHLGTDSSKVLWSDR